jgi:peptidoglycan L-alanyl-D-glutamate endopeptidase CwlK
VDARSEENIATLHPRLQPIARALIAAAARRGMNFKITSGTRTFAEQDALYEQGRTEPGKRVTNARGGSSNHNYGIAFDVTEFEADNRTPIYDGPNYRKLSLFGKELGLFWGGDWTSPVDEPHYELRPAWAGADENAMLAELHARHVSGKDVFI